MRITIVANGSRGDVQPFVGLGLGLRAAGCDVCVAAPTPFRAFVEGRGLRFADLEVDPREILEGELGKAWIETGHNPFGFVHKLEPILAPLMDRFLAASLRACQGADALIFAPFGVVAWHIGQALGIPAILASPVPAVRTAYFPSPLVPPLPLPRLTNPLGYRLVDQLTWQMFRRYANRWRVERLGLPALPLRGPFREIEREREIVLHGYSPFVLPKPPDWGSHVHVTGYWFLDRPDGWQPPATLKAFLADGPPPVYIGLGSMTGRDPEALTRLALGALRRTGQRGVLLAGWAGLGGSTCPAMSASSMMSRTTGSSPGWPPWPTMAEQGRPPPVSAPAAPASCSPTSPTSRSGAVSSMTSGLARVLSPRSSSPSLVSLPRSPAPSPRPASTAARARSASGFGTRTA